MLKSRDMAKYSDEDLLWRRIRTRFNRGIARYGLIDDGDRIMVALSGGKDSLALLSLLAEKSRIFKPRFSVVAVHVVMRNALFMEPSQSTLRESKGDGLQQDSARTSYG